MSPSSSIPKDSEQEESSPIITTNNNNSSSEPPDKPTESIAAAADEELPENKPDDLNDDADPMDEDVVKPAVVFCIRLKQPRSNLLHKMSVPELCRKFRYYLFMIISFV